MLRDPLTTRPRRPSQFNGPQEHAHITQTPSVPVRRDSGLVQSPMSQPAEPLVLYIRPLRQVFCSLSWLPSASSVPWFSSASAAWPSAPSSGACRSFPCGRRSVLNAGSDLQPICLALNHPARLLTIRSFSQRTVYFLLPPIGLSRPMPTGLQNGSPASKAAKAARRVCGPRRCVPAWLRSA